MITEVSPAPKIYMFYALFQTVGVRISIKEITLLLANQPVVLENVRICMFTIRRCFARDLSSSQQIGPFIGSAIIADSHGNNNTTFYLLFPMMLIGYALIWMVDPDKAKIDNAKCERIHLCW